MVMVVPLPRLRERQLTCGAVAGKGDLAVTATRLQPLVEAAALQVPL
jgi:hypothetical protein